MAPLQPGVSHALDVARLRPYAGADWAGIEALLELARRHLGMDMASLTEICDGRQRFRAIAGDTSAVTADILEGIEYASSLGAQVVAGALPPYVRDVHGDPRVRDLPHVRSYAVGSYIGLPWSTADGRLGGIVACTSRGASEHLGDREVRFLQHVTEMIADHLETPAGVATREAADERDVVEAILTAGALTTAFQPIVDLEDRTVVAFEALSRFASPLFPTPDLAFHAADRAGRGSDLELLAVQRAFEQLDDVFPGIRLSVNLSAAAIARPDVQRTLLGHAHRRIGVEITEHVPVGDYAALHDDLAPLREAGIAIVVDDAGAGYAGFQHVLRIAPDAIKLDISLTRDVDTDPARRALTRSLIDFSEEVGAALIAEGIETEGELATLRELGVHYGQGFLLGRPGAL